MVAFEEETLSRLRGDSGVDEGSEAELRETKESGLVGRVCETSPGPKEVPGQDQNEEPLQGPTGTNHVGGRRLTLSDVHLVSTRPEVMTRREVPSPDEIVDQYFGGPESFRSGSRLRRVMED